jgi:hypothetical protein
VSWSRTPRDSSLDSTRRNDAARVTRVPGEFPPGFRAGGGGRSQPGPRCATARNAPDCQAGKRVHRPGRPGRGPLMRHGALREPRSGPHVRSTFSRGRNAHPGPELLGRRCIFSADCGDAPNWHAGWPQLQVLDSGLPSWEQLLILLPGSTRGAALNEESSARCDPRA